MIAVSSGWESLGDKVTTSRVYENKSNIFTPLERSRRVQIFPQTGGSNTSRHNSVPRNNDV